MFDPISPHPLITVDAQLSSDDLLTKINELRKKMNIVYSFPNPDVYVLQQMQLAIQSYSDAYQSKLAEERRDDDSLDKLIDIN